MTRFVAFLSSSEPLHGRCPACDGLMDETACRIGDHFIVKPGARGRTGIGQIVEVFCEGTPSVPVQECPACAP